MDILQTVQLQPGPLREILPEDTKIDAKSPGLQHLHRNLYSLCKYSTNTSLNITETSTMLTFKNKMILNWQLA